MSMYQRLFAPSTLGIPGMVARFERLSNPPPLELISNINCVPFAGELCVILKLADGSIEMPGGTLEQGETYEETLRRELFEEAGARLLDFAPLGAWHTTSSLSEPFRPHLPHPNAYRYVVVASVELVRSPTNDGEQVVSVERVSVSEAADQFNAAGRPDLAELYQLAAQGHVQK